MNLDVEMILDYLGSPMLSHGRALRVRQSPEGKSEEAGKQGQQPGNTGSL